MTGLTMIPSPHTVANQEKQVPLPTRLTVSGDVTAWAAARPLLRLLEDSGAVSQVIPDDDGFLRLERTDADDEAYSIIVDTDGIVITGGQGLRHGIATLCALLPPECLRPGAHVAATLPAVTMTDAPRYRWRGLLIDVARHYMPVAWLRSVIDIAAFHKLNVVHLHLTDDQGWRMPIDAFPRLATVGSWRSETLVGPAPGSTFDGRAHGGAYTKEELRALVRYAHDRGIMVVPEIDLPGHMVAAIAAYPEWGNQAEPVNVLTTWGISSNIINTRPTTIDALKQILDEVMDVFDAPYLHLGGDEVPTYEWETSDEVAALMEAEGIASVRDVQGWLMRQLVAHVEAAGRQVIVWDEAMAAEGMDGAIVQAWTSPDAVERGLRFGSPTIASPQQHYYLNWSATTGEDEPLGFGVGKQLAISLRQAWDYVPPAEVIGIEAALWGEYIATPEKASYHLLPRLAAVAERAWSGTRLTWEEFEAKMPEQVARYAALGWEYRPLDGPGRWSRIMPAHAGSQARRKARIDG